MLRARVLSALIFVPIAALIVWAGGWWFFAATALVASVAGYEFIQLLRRGGYAPTTIFALAIIGVSLFDA